MRCPKCGKPVRRGDKYCVNENCGAKLQRIPSWVKIVSVIVVVVVGATLVWFFIPLNPYNNTNLRIVPRLVELPQSDLLVKQTEAHAKWLSVKTPVIDGVLTPGEWLDTPVISETFPYTIYGINKTGNISIYLMNDDSSLYFAMTVTAGDFREDNFRNGPWEFNVDLFFNGNDDKYYQMGMFPGNQHFQSYYEDKHSSAHMQGRDASQDGKAAMTFIDNKSTFTYEGSFPLNSGDPEDLSAKPGDTVSILIDLTQVRINPIIHFASFRGDWTWPTGGGATYGKLVLATNSMSTPLPSITPTPTPMQTTSANPSPGPVLTSTLSPTSTSTEAPTNKTSTPIITSLSKIVANKDQTIIIQGQGFGSLAPYNGDSSYIKIYDVTAQWGAGYTGPGESDAVTLNITEWSDTKIMISGFTGSYGGSWSLHIGDQLQIQVWNASSGMGPALYQTDVSPD